MGPSAFSYSVGVPEEGSYAAEYPARTFPVNASTPPLRAAPHDSGPMWVATSHSYDFCIHYTSPVLTGAQGEKNNELEIAQDIFCGCCIDLSLSGCARSAFWGERNRRAEW